MNYSQRLGFLFLLIPLFLTGCSSSPPFSSADKEDYDGINYKGQLNDPIMVITLLSEQQREWAGVPYLLGGNTRSGIDCSGFTRTTFKDRFNIQLPRTTKEQSRYGKKVPRSQIQTGDLVFFKTGRGPFGYHVGIYVKEDKFLHASTKGGVIYSSLNSPYWTKVFWQARRI
ncbi:C40 family peptidase [Lonepinella sp. BR2474]|uniref:C40 family peptidase n=1 Tax=Lonepinella sp. BR2474 TaxID=3434548 RepID=UPI003F6DA741